MKTQRRGVVRVVHGEPGDAEFARRRNQLGEALLDRRVSEAMPCIGAERNGGKLSNNGLCLTIDLATLHVTAIELQPVEAVAGEA